MTETSHLVKSVAALFGARVLGVVGVTVATIFLARSLGPDVYGSFALLSALVAILGVFADAGVSPSMARYVSENAGDGTGVTRVLRQGLLIKCCLMTVCSLVLVNAMPFLSDLLADPHVEKYGGLVLLVLWFSEAVRFLAKSHEGLRRMDVYALVNASQGILYPVLAVSFVLSGWGLAGALVGFMGALAVHTALGSVSLCRIVLRLRRLMQPGPIATTTLTDAAWLSRILHYSIPMALVSAGSFIYLKSDALIISAFLDSAEVGHYNVQFKIVSLMALPAIVLGIVVAPHFTAGSEPLRWHADMLHRCLRYALLISCPAAVLMVLVPDLLIDILFGEAYRPAVNVLRIFGAGFLPAYATAAVVSPTLNYRGQAAYRARIIAVSAGANIGLNLFMIPRYGLIGAALSTLVTYLPTVALFLRQLAISVKTSLAPFVASAARIFLAGCIMGVSVLCVRWLVAQPLASLLLSALVGGLVYLGAAWGLRVLRREDIAGIRSAIQHRQRPAFRSPGPGDLGP